MSVYIPGMEMPKPGRYEAVIIVLDNSTAEIAISPSEDDIGYWKEYPLVPVPEHGDLKDADAVGDFLRNKYWNSPWVRSHILDKIVRDIKGFQTIIPEDKEQTYDGAI